jgi:AAA domain
VDYDRLEREVAQREQKPPRDLSRAWERFRPLGEADEVVLARIQHFCEGKRISLTALECMGTRWTVRNGGAVWLAWAASAQLNGTRVVTAVKARELGSGERSAEPGSVFVEPLVLGNPQAPNWYLFEGESDAARGLELVGGKAAVMVLPAGALTFRPEWASVIPRGATVYCCHDADEAGDRGAAKVARIIGSRAVRLRPPVEGGDWCDWPGEREQFAELVAAGVGEAVLELRSARELCALPDPPEDEQLLGPLLLRGQRLVLGAHTGEGKTSMALQIARALTEKTEFLEWQGAGGRVLVLDAEQGLRTVKRRLREVGLHESDGVDYVRVPDGLALDSDERHVAEVEQALEQGGYTLVVADPLYKLHTGDSNDEREAVDLMRRFDGWRERFGFALLLPVHCRKPVPGMKFSIHDLFGSSAYVRGAEVVLGLRRVSDGYAKLHFLKDRDGDLPIGVAWGLLFDQEEGFRRDPNDGVVRNLREELLELLGDGEWWTLTTLRKTKDEGGVGADRDKIKAELEGMTVDGSLEFELGPEGQRRDAKCWRLKRRETVDDGDDAYPKTGREGEAEGRSVVASSPIEETHADDASTDTSRDDDEASWRGDDA